jgi:hypothetical protein
MGRPLGCAISRLIRVPHETRFRPGVRLFQLPHLLSRRDSSAALWQSKGPRAGRTQTDSLGNSGFHDFNQSSLVLGTSAVADVTERGVARNVGVDGTMENQQLQTSCLHDRMTERVGFVQGSHSHQPT